MSDHTPGPWVAVCNTVFFGKRGGINLRYAPDSEANARLIAASPDLFKELKTIVYNEEQSSFEQWLQRVMPSGDCDSVHAQWVESADYADFLDLWKGPIEAIQKVRGES